MLNVRDTSRFYEKNVGFSVLSYLNISLLKIGIFWKWDLECSERHKTCPTNSSRGSSPGTLGTRLCVLLWWNQYLLLLTAKVAHDPRFSSKKNMDLKLFNLKCLLKFQLALPTPRPQRNTFTVQLTGPCFSCWSGLLPLGSLTLCSAS